MIPKGNQGSIIITSQDGDSKKLVDASLEALYVGIMEPQEAQTLLLQYLRLSLDLVPADIL